MKHSTSTLERFEARVDRSHPNGCWIWTGGKFNTGYGQLHPKGGGNGSTMLAHHFAWTFYCGQIPEGKWILHHCDTPACVNPEHLFLGTARDNKLDCVKKGRARGCAMPKLSIENVREIRSSTEPSWVLSKQFSVNRETIRKILRGDTWTAFK